MSKTIDHQRFTLWRRLKFQHNIYLTGNAIETIESFFHESIKTSIYHVGMYRAINMVFCVMFLVAWILFNDTEMWRWFVPFVMAGFMFYNAIHLLVNWYNYKTIPEPEPVDPDLIPDPEEIHKPKINPDVKG